MAKLTIQTEDQSPETLKLESREYILGRGGDLPNPIRDLDVSRHHAKLSAQRDGWWLTDLDSANGTWLNGDILETPQRLRTGDEIRVGQTRIRFELTTEVTHSISSWELHGRSANVKGRQISIKDGLQKLGRDADHPISISDPSVSRHHADLILEGDKLHLRDAGSRNTSRVDGKPVKQVTLKHGDIIQFGTVVFEVRKSANQFRDRRKLYNRIRPWATISLLVITILAGVAQLVLEKRLEAQEPETRSELLKREIADRRREGGAAQNSGQLDVALVKYQDILQRDPLDEYARAQIKVIKDLIDSEDTLNRANAFLDREHPLQALKELDALPVQMQTVKGLAKLRLRASKQLKAKELPRLYRLCRAGDYRRCHNLAVEIGRHYLDSQITQLIVKTERELLKRKIPYIPASVEISSFGIDSGE